MIIKALRKMEVLRGFIQIPVKNRFELIGNASLPYLTTLNGSPARLDKQGRLWSSYLKNKFSINEEIALDKTESGYRVMPVNNTKSLTSDGEHQENVMLLNADLENETNVWYKVLEGDCLKHFNEGSVTNVDLTFFDPPYRQGKDYRFFDDNQPAWKY